MVLNKLQEKYDAMPKFVIQQTKKFNIPIWTYDLQSYVDNDAIADYIVSQKHTLNYNTAWKDAGDILHNWHTNLIDRNDNTNPDLEKLFKIATQKVSKIWGYTDNYETMYSFLLEHYLLSIYNQNDYIDWHDHGISAYSASYYARVPANSSNIIFENEKQELEVEVKSGMLVLFPGNARHRTYPSQHQGDRIVVTMNFFKDRLINKIKKEIMDENR